MTKSSGFQVVGSYRRNNSIEFVRGTSDYYRVYEDWFFLSCGKCTKCISAFYSLKKKNSEFGLDTAMKGHGSLAQFDYKYGDHMPKDASTDEPLYLPEKVAIPFRQSVSNVAASNWDAAGVMARKTLEVATKDIVRQRFDSEDERERLIKNTWLKARIRKLKETGYLTDGLSDLATLIKDEGDDATHEEEPYTESEARELVGYAQALLTYVYSIPGMVAKVREKVEGADSLRDHSGDSAAKTVPPSKHDND